MRRAFVIAILTTLTGCASTQAKVVVLRSPRATLDGPRSVAFVDAGSAQYAIPIGAVRARFADRLEANSIEVKRFVKDDVRYGIEVRGQSETCDRGYRFVWIELDLIDFRNNVTVLSLHGEGPTEGCVVGEDMSTGRPRYGTLFDDLAGYTADAWR